MTKEAVTPAEGDMSPEDFRRYGHQVVEMAAAYLESLPELSPLANTAPGAVLAALPRGAPEAGEPMDSILQDVSDLLIPASTHWNHPRFFAYFNSSSSAPGILAEFLTATLNVNAMLWRTGPAATELEFLVCRWLGELVGLPSTFDGHINDTASSSTLVALAAAREALGAGVRDLGLSGQPQLIVYASEQAHSSVEKAVVTLGLGRAGFRAVPVDGGYRMVTSRLEAMIAEDLGAGRRPCAVVATTGTTATTSVDPVPEVADVCRRHGVWLHVDAAYGGVMGLLPEGRWVLEGVERAQSVVINPHKWLFTPLDCSVLWTSRPDVLRRAFSLVPEYLTTPEAGREQGMGARNLMDFGVSLGRRMRALKLWMVIRYFGHEGLAARLRSHLGMAAWLRERIVATDGWEMSAPMPMATLCFRHLPPGVVDEARLEAHNRAVMARVNSSGRVFISHAVLDGRFVLHASIGGLRTSAEDVEILWETLQAAARTTA